MVGFVLFLPFTVTVFLVNRPWVDVRRCLGALELLEISVIVDALMCRRRSMDMHATPT